jgi:hypothetical protein
MRRMQQGEARSRERASPVSARVFVSGRLP